MFKVKAQRLRSQDHRSRSQRKVVYQQQKRYKTAKSMDRFSDFKHGVVIKAGKDWRGSGGLSLQFAIVTFSNLYFVLGGPTARR